MQALSMFLCFSFNHLTGNWYAKTLQRKRLLIGAATMFCLFGLAATMLYFSQINTINYVGSFQGNILVQILEIIAKKEDHHEVLAVCRALDTTRIRAFAECRRLFRVLFIGHSAKKTLSSAALGKVLRSVKSLFTECRTLDKDCFAERQTLGKDDARQRAVSDRLQLTVVSLCRGPKAGTRQSRFFAECQISGTRQRGSLPSVFCGHSAKHIFIFFFILATKEVLYRVSES
jgi:hypothetical protein